MTLADQLKSATSALTVRQVADILHCHEMTIYEWVAAGKIPHMRVGRRIKFDGATLAVWLDSRTLAA